MKLFTSFILLKYIDLKPKLLPVKTHPRTIVIKTVNDLITYTDQHSDSGQIRLYRGQMEDWSLQPKLTRLVRENLFGDSFFDIEKRMFDKFLGYFRKRYPSYSNYGYWELLAIGQHYGLPTRLLDWSRNPLVALWFAFEENNELIRERIVWGLVADSDVIFTDLSNKESGDSRFIKIFEPPKIEPRIIAQEAWLSIHRPKMPSSNEQGDGIPSFGNYNIMNESFDFQHQLVKIKIPNNRELILKELNDHGINKDSIYPDLEKLCKEIQDSEFPRDGKVF